jgi:ribosomal protein S27E
MIPNDILEELVPSEASIPSSVIDDDFYLFDADGVARRIGMWSAYLRVRLREMTSEDRFFRTLVESSAFVATGIFRSPYETEFPFFSGFPAVRGFQFGVMLMRGSFSERAERSYVGSVPMIPDDSYAPVIQTLAQFQEQSKGPDGCIAATFRDNEGRTSGITARHVVRNKTRGRRVPIECPDCGEEATLIRFAPGLIDAAVVNLPCGPCGWPALNPSGGVRRAIEGEAVEAHFGISGKAKCTIMSTLQTPSQVISAAVPEHFLIDLHGYPGDSGSLVSSIEGTAPARDLLGLYLGQTDCEDEARNQFTYGYALDLRQAVRVCGIDHRTIEGVFND